MDLEFRKQLKVACRLFGGQKAVATAAGVKESNFGRWLAGHPTLSEKNVAAVLSALGLPNLSPENIRVISFFFVSMPVLAKPTSIISILKLYFPNGGEIAIAPWTPRTLDGSLKQWVSGPWGHKTVTYAITD